MLRTIGVTFACALLAACARDLRVDDLALIEVRSALWNDVARRIDEPVQEATYPGRLLVTIAMATDRDLWMDGHRRNLNVVAEIRICDARPDALPIGGALYVQDRHKRLRRMDSLSPPKPSPRATAGRDLLLVLDVRTTGSISFSGRPSPPYDLLKEPVDLCARLAGGGFAGIGHVTSNEVRISGAAIRRALAHQP